MKSGCLDRVKPSLACAALFAVPALIAACGSDHGGGTTTAGATTGSGGGGGGAVSSSESATTGSVGGGTATGASCGHAIDITSAIAASGKFHGEATGAASVTASCASVTGAVAWLRYEVPSTGNYAITVSGGDGALVVRSGCTPGAFELGCNAAAGSSATTVGLTGGQDVFLALAGDALQGGFDVTIAPSAACVDASDCAGLACAPDGACVECMTDDDCSIGDCDPVFRRCSPCSDLLCANAPKGAACDAITGKCGCLADADCPLGSQVCSPEGVCGAAPIEVLVDDTTIHCLAASDTQVFYGRTQDGVWSKDLSGAAPVQIATGAEPRGFALDAANVYWVGDGFAMSMPLAGGAPAMLYTGPLALGAEPPGCGGVAVDATDLYAATGTGVVRIPLAGGAATMVASGEQGVSYVALGPSDVFFTSGAIKRVPKSGGAVSVVAAIDTTFQIVLDGSLVYAFRPGSTADEIVQVPASGGTVGSPGTELEFAL